MSEKRNIDWQSVHQKLDESSLLLNAAFEPTPEAIERTLATRAAHLARRENVSARKTGLRTVLLLEAGGQTAGIEIHGVQEVVNLAQSYTPVLDAHPLLLGVVNVHNQLVNLVNPLPLLNESADKDSGAFTQAVMLRHPHLKVAIGCTQVLDLVELPEEAWQSDRLFFFSPAKSPGVLLDIGTLLHTWEKQA